MARTALGFNPSKSLCIVLSALVLGVILLIAGGVIFGTSQQHCEPSPTATSQSEKRGRSCELSDEAKRSGFGTFLDKVKARYYELHPFKIHYNSDLWYKDDFSDQIKAIYISYDPSPEAIKRRTDASFRLLKEMKSLDISLEKLKGRERKAYSKAVLYLQQVFGQPFEVNYYTGDWMLGPDSFCYSTICYMGYDLYNSMLYHFPKNLKDVELVKSKLMSHQKALIQYVENLKMGVRRGMVRNIESCKAGLEAFKIEHPQISLHGAKGKVTCGKLQPSTHMTPIGKCSSGSCAQGLHDRKNVCVWRDGVVFRCQNYEEVSLLQNYSSIN